MPTAPYGSWRSPITADLILTSTVGVSQPQLAGDTTYWIESRPTEAGRNVIVRRNPDGTTEDINPAPMNARTRVHEYGGGDCTVDGQTVYWVNFTDQQIYISTPNAEPIRLTGNPDPTSNEPPSSSSPSPATGRGPGGGVPSPYRYADLTLDRIRNRRIAVREDHTNPDPHHVQNAIVAIPLASSGNPLSVNGEGAG